MAITFDTLFAAQAWEPLAAMFGEPLVYTPLDGAPREIVCIVTRSPEVGADGMSGLATPSIVVVCLNDPVEGISSAELDRGGDSIEVSELKGAEAIARSNIKVLDDSGGCLRLAVR